MYVHLTNINTVLDQLDCMYYCLNRASQHVDGQIEVCSSDCDVCFVCFQEKGPGTSTRVRELLPLVTLLLGCAMSLSNVLFAENLFWVKRKFIFY